MKKFKNLKTYNRLIISLVIAFGACFNSNAQVREDNFKADYQQFLENQKTPFLKADGEIFVLDGVAWVRKYGEQEYCLTPVFANNDVISEYKNRIRQLDDPQNGIIKSKHHFVQVEVTPASKALLKKRNINVPHYVQNKVNVYLPEIDIDKLTQKGIAFKYLINYGQKTGKINNVNANAKMQQATIWSEGFEGGFPGSAYQAVSWTSVDCKWDDVNCYSYSGSRSLWGSDLGTDCNSPCTTYKNNMGTWASIISPINTDCYTNRQFIFYRWHDMGNNDQLEYYLDVGTGWLLVGQWSGVSGGWQPVTQGFATGTTLKWQFDFTSNWTGTGPGVYIDALQITGTQTTPPSTTYGSWSTCSNCSKSRTVTTYSWSATSPCYTSSTSTQTQACSTPPSPTSWSACSGNKQTRTVYTCSGGTPVPSTETQCCGTIPSTSYGSWSTCSSCSKSRSVTTYSSAPSPTCVTSNTTTETQACSTPPSSTSWSTCSNNEQYRTVYTCSGGTPVPSTEYQCCDTPPATDYGAWSACSNCSKSRTVTTYSWVGTYPTCVTSNTTTETQACSSISSNPTSQNVSSCGSCDGTVSANASGGTLPYTYQWTGGTINCNASSCSNVCAGTYTVTVTDAGGCTITVPAPPISEPGAPIPNIFSQTNAAPDNCNGTATVTASGGTTPYAYLWSNGQTTAQATGLCCDNTYNVTVTGGGCNASTSVTIPWVPGCMVGVEEIDFINNLSIHPNPNTGEFIIEMEITQPENLEIKLLNVIGQVIYEEKLSKFSGVYQKTIDVGNQAKGIYSLQIITENGTINKKLIIN